MTGEQQPPTTQGTRAVLQSLRSTWGTRWAMRFLFVLMTLAIITPLLPLTPPHRSRLNEQLEPPSFTPLWRDDTDPLEIKTADPLSKGLLHARKALFGNRSLGPILGTDALGRCLLSRLLWGARLSLAVGLVASIISLIIGVLFGGIAGYRGGKTDQIMMRFVDVLYALPLMFMVIFVVALLRGLRESKPELEIPQVLVLFAVIGGISWLTMARIVRGQVMSIKNSDFVSAAVLAGSPPLRVLFVHLLPNALPVILVTLTLTIPRVMLFEAYLSFLGLGVESPDVSWGLLARQGFDALTAVHTSPWLILFPGLAFAATLLSMNVLGDGLRDAMDPKLKRRPQA